MSDQAAGENPTLETRLGRLERIVERLERDDLELEQALELFEEGVGHVRAAEEILSEAELRIDRLLEDDDGVRLEPVGRDEG